MKISIEGEHYVIKDDGKNLNKLRALPAREWKGGRDAWFVPIYKETFNAMRSAGFPIEGLKPPTRSAYRVERHSNNTSIILRTLGTPQDIMLCRKIPEARSFDRTTGGWICRPSKLNVQYIRRAFPQAIWEGSAEHIVDAFEGAQRLQAEQHVATQVEKMSVLVDEKVTDYKYFTKPYDHQDECFRLSRKAEYFALLMQQGTGKTKVIVDTAAYNFQQANITAMFIVCPNAAKDVWLEELEAHLPKDVVLDVFIWSARTRHKAESWILRSDPGERPLRVFIMNVEALSGEIGTKVADLFLSRHGCLMAIDEFTRIKSPVAARSKNCLRLGKKAQMRRILSGVPVTQGPLDVFVPFKFLHPSILGFNTFYAMRNRHALLGGFQGRQIIGYAYVDEIQAKIKTVSYRKLRSECLDLPGKVYEKLVIELTPKQRELYDQMATEMKASIDWLNPETPSQVEVLHAVTKIMRLQQIVGGFVPIQEQEGGRYKAIPIPGDNPKLLALTDAIEDLPDDEKVVIWAHFRPELFLLSKTLKEQYGEDSVVDFYGGVPNEIRQAKRRDFQQNPRGARFFVGQEQSGGVSLTLTASCLTYYFSNGQSLEDRLQSEDREDRIGQTRKVIVTDIMAKGTSDVRIINGYRNKKRLADLITGDPSLSWV